MKRERALVIIPVLLFVLAIIMVNIRGPYYLGRNFDPEYCYLLNSLSILELKVPGHIDHPGTTLQVWGAASMLAKWLVASVFGFEERLDVSVLSHPENYLLVMNVTLNLLVCGLLFWTARTMLRMTGSIVPGLVMQVSWLAFIRPLEAHARVSPEPLLMAVVLALALALIPVLFGPDPDEAARRSRTAIIAGAVFGFGVVTKVTFIPLAALALVFPGWRQKARFLGAATVSAAIFLFPIWSQLQEVFRWLLRLATNTGLYGSGPRGLPGPKEYAGRLYGQFLHEPMLFLFLLFFGMLVLLSVMRGRQFSGVRGETDRRLWIGACLAIGILIAISAKNSIVAHYLLPAVALVPVLCAVLAERLRAKAFDVSLESGFASLGVVLLIAGFVVHVRDLDIQMHLSMVYRSELAQQQRLAQEQGDCQLIGVYRSSIPTFALDFGNSYIFWRYADTLRALYPDHTAYGTTQGPLRRFIGFANESREEVVRQQLDQGACLLVQGNWNAIKDIKGYRFEPISEAGREEVLVRLTGVTQLESEFTPPAGTLTIEAEEFAERENVGVEGEGIVSTSVPSTVVYRFDLPAGGPHELLLRYTSEGGRALTVRLNGEVVTESAGAGIAEGPMWERVGVYELAPGANELSFERDAPFPKIDRLVIAPVEGVDGGA